MASHSLPDKFAGLQFDNTYARLPARFHARVNPTPVQAPALIRTNETLATELGLDAAALVSPAGIAMLAGNSIAPGSEPLAQAYAGHQFGHFSPQLGDGRAILLGEITDPAGRRYDIQLKGAGRTPWSRSGDGRAALGPVVREYLVSEAMQVLGIKTTRALAAVTTGEPVFREAPLPGAILTRIASSHLRVGTFEYFWGQSLQSELATLADYTITRHFPEAREADNPALALLDAVMQGQASLVASWMHVGFVHGVMNTDNTSICGETIDYGPCAFIDAYHPDTVFSSIDAHGRYAFGQQPSIALWNLTRLAECLLPLIDRDAKKAVALAEGRLNGFGELFNHYWLEGMRRKLGLTRAQDGDMTLIQELLRMMQSGSADYTLTFRLLGDSLVDEGTLAQLMEMVPTIDSQLHQWRQRWLQRLEGEHVELSLVAERMRQVNPLYIPRNHQVEAVITAAVADGDFGPMETLHRVLANPYQVQEGMEHYARPPSHRDPSYRTFCGT